MCYDSSVENTFESSHVMRQTLFAITIFWLLCTSLIASPEIPGAPQQKPIAIVGATIHPVSGKSIESGTILFDKGRIVAIGTKVDVPKNASVIKAGGKHIYPGLFNTDGILGLIEINAVRASDDIGEVGQWNMNVRAEKAINPDSELIPVTRSGGVLFNLTAPRGGTISGTSAVLQLDGWTTEDLTIKAPSGMHIRWPIISSPKENEHDHGHEDDKNDDDDKALRGIEDIFEKARVYQKARKADSETPVDLRWEAMLPVLSGEVPIVATADRAAQIQSAVAFASRHELQLIISGGHDAAQCGELLKSQKVPVIVQGVYQLPLRRREAYDSAYTLPARLKKAGVQFCIAGSARFDAANIRNLPYHAAMAHAFGLSKEDALKSITLYPAEILGVADRIGSLEIGKHASLIVLDGELFDTASNVTHAWVQGRKVDLSNRHKRLYKKYSERQKQTAAK